MANNKDFKVKNGIQPTVYHEAVGTVVSGAEGYYLSGASYDSVSNSVIVSTRDCVFKPDGTKMFTVSSNDDLMHEYDLSTAWDVSTAVRNASNDLDVSTQGATSLFSLAFKSDGTKCYACDNGTNSIYQYSLSTAWDLSTASFDSSVSVLSNGRFPHGFVLKTDGTSFYVLGTNLGIVYQYNMSTAYEISTASYANKSLTLTTSYEDIEISSDGTTLYALLSGGVDTIYQYSLTTAWDLSTATDASISFYIGGQELAPQGITFANSGKNMYLTGGSTIYQYSTVLNTAELDLSTGSVFDYTPTSDVQVTLTNPAASGTSSGATLLLTGPSDSIGVSSTFSTTLYEGNGGTQTITNGIDLAGDGGMVWGKIRSATDHHWIVDSENGIGSNGTYNYLEPSLTTSLRNFGDRSVKTLNSDGFTLANSTNDQFNLSSATYVSWTFKKQTKFFDVQTFTTTYNNDPNVISHDLDVDLGCAIFKQTGSGTQGVNWIVYHRSLGLNKYLVLNSTASEVADNNSFEAVDNSAGTISVGYPVSDSASRMVSGGQETSYWVGYFFAHNDGDGGFGPDADQDIIKCGSYAGNGSNTGPVINLGFEPQWLLIKRATGTANWFLVDTKRGLPVGSNSNALFPNNSNAEDTNAAAIDVLPTGFQPKAGSIYINGSGDTYIYVAIRGESIPTITYDSDLQWSGGTAPTAPAIGETDVITFNTTDGGTTYKSALAIDGAK